MSDTNGTILRDVLFLAVLAFLACVVLMLPWVNPPGQKSSNDSPRAGSLTVELRWPDGMTSDLDLWGLTPQGERVGFLNKHGQTMDLLRDDLGGARDILNLNYEHIVSHGVFPGIYAVNVHWYSNSDGEAEAPAGVVISFSPEREYPLSVFAQRRFTMTEPHQEKTFVVFEIVKMKNGLMRPESVYLDPGFVPVMPDKAAPPDRASS